MDMETEDKKGKLSTLLELAALILREDEMGEDTEEEDPEKKKMKEHHKAMMSDDDYMEMAK